MKMLFTVVFIAWAQSLVFGQTLPNLKLPETPVYCALTHDGEQWTLTRNDTARHCCSLIMIEGLPPLTISSTPMNLFITSTGSYMLKKDPSLVIPDDYTVLVEDLLTGGYYNLNSPEPYTFTINKEFNRTRFLLKIGKSSPELVTVDK